MTERGNLGSEGEIIGIKETLLPGSGRIKIKIKERLPGRKKKRAWGFTTKIISILLACLLGLYVGSKIVERYFSYWQKPRIEYISEGDSKIPQLKAGEVFSAGSE